MGVHASGKHLSAISDTFSRSFKQRIQTDQSNGFSDEKNGSKHFPGCTRVNLSGNMITDSTLHSLVQNLQKLKQLKYLELSNTGLGACNPQSICQLIQNVPNLEYIDLSRE
ncbi:hypothetical protein PHET_05530 [Paragonimus heterotremus]|uniref:Uncharacterized protein n=1 Tax=Paragonimus heterotremus TaxID=100268 RepID=A0A8J4WIG2_9TREM|nr:hypothetical protein PHET_05530 [Paragonimus heterotremus]